MTPREKMAEKVKEIKEKYADVINDLSVKYDKDVGVAFFYLIAIPRAVIIGEAPLYSADIEYNLDELCEDYIEYLELAKEVL